MRHRHRVGPWRRRPRVRPTAAAAGPRSPAIGRPPLEAQRQRVLAGQVWAGRGQEPHARGLVRAIVSRRAAARRPSSARGGAPRHACSGARPVHVRPIPTAAPNAAAAAAAAAAAVVVVVVVVVGAAAAIIAAARPSSSRPCRRRPACCSGACRRSAGRRLCGRRGRWPLWARVWVRVFVCACDGGE
jgi:hypothetical protein